ARAPSALAPLLELLHHLVAVARLLAKEEQDRGADVAAAHPPAPAEAGAAEAGAAKEELGAERTGAARVDLVMEDAIVSMHNEIGYRYIGSCQEIHALLDFAGARRDTHTGVARRFLSLGCTARR